MSEVAPSVGGGAPTGPTQLTPPARGDPATAEPIIGRIIAASARLDPHSVAGQLDLAATVLGLGRCIDEVVLPAARRLQQAQAAQQRTAAGYLMGVEAIRTWLNHQALYAPVPTDVGPILLACGSREPHPIALESLALLLRYDRWPCQVLGTRVSTFTLTIAAQAADAAAVIVTSDDSRGLARATVLLRAADALGVPVFFAGDSFDLEAGRRQLPGRYLGTDLRRACSIVCAALTPGVPPRAPQSRRSVVNPGTTVRYPIAGSAAPN